MVRKLWARFKRKTRFQVKKSPQNVQEAQNEGERDEPAEVREKYVTRQAFILTDLISEILPTEERFTIIDGGAREALADPRWRCFDPGRIRLYGFEPDEVEVEKLNTEAAELGLDYRYFPGALWSQKTNITFHENKSPGGGSCFPQNTSITDRWKFQNTKEYFLSSEIFYPLGTSTWKTITLDDWSRELGGVDLIL